MKERREGKKGRLKEERGGLVMVVWSLTRKYNDYVDCITIWEFSTNYSGLFLPLHHLVCVHACMFKVDRLPRALCPVVIKTHYVYDLWIMSKFVDFYDFCFAFSERVFDVRYFVWLISCINTRNGKEVISYYFRDVLWVLKVFCVVVPQRTCFFDHKKENTFISWWLLSLFS